MRDQHGRLFAILLLLELQEESFVNCDRYLQRKCLLSLSPNQRMFFCVIFLIGQKSYVLEYKKTKSVKCNGIFVLILFPPPYIKVGVKQATKVTIINKTDQSQNKLTDFSNVKAYSAPITMFLNILFALKKMASRNDVIVMY